MAAWSHRSNDRAASWCGFSLPLEWNRPRVCLAVNRLVLLLLLSMAGGAVQADSLQCGTTLVGTGDTRDQVMAKCGNPSDIERSTAFVQSVAWVNGVPVSAGNTLIEVPVELWLYNFGPSQLMRRVRFESGRVVMIEILGYGYVPESR
jgi:hypothetical protein